ncbi:MAG: Crp/Fnr family transcriptional regulator [Phaeodactylibacter sp.]|nr:Crp/Fnr family transcriptional regulator [Phaeodactylibacter sp.]
MNNLEAFWKFTDQLVLLMPREKQRIQPYLQTKSVPKGTILVDLGAIARETYFIVKGCLRFYYLTDEGKEITGFIFQEYMFAGSHESFFSQVPSVQVLECLEDSELITLTYSDLQQLFEEVPRMNVLVRKLLEQRMANAQRVLASLIIHKPEERYTRLLDQQPELLQRIPHHILATYLGITPVSMSRIRRKIRDKED